MRPEVDPPVKAVTELRGPNTEGIPQALSVPAISVNAKIAISSSAETRTGNGITRLIESKIVPFHVFVDLGLALGPDSFLTFLDHAMGSEEIFGGGKTGTDEESGSVSTSEEEGHRLPVAPGVIGIREKEKAKRRLERLVLKDLDLELDYLKKESVEKVRKSRRKVVFIIPDPDDALTFSRRCGTPRARKRSHVYPLHCL